MRILGTVAHSIRYYALSYDDNADTGLVFSADTLIIESGGSINVTDCGYRGYKRDGWTGTRSETYPGLLGATGNSGGSHGGYGGSSSGDAGNVFGVQDEPLTFGAGGAGYYSGPNGGGLVRLDIGLLILQGGSIIADGGSAWGYGGGFAAGGAAGSINLRIDDASGTGTIRATGGRGNGYPFNGCGGGGGRIAIRYGAGDISGWTIQAQGGDGYSSAPDGGEGTVYTEQVTPRSDSQTQNPDATGKEE